MVNDEKARIRLKEKMILEKLEKNGKIFEKRVEKSAPGQVEWLLTLNSNIM